MIEVVSIPETRPSTLIVMVGSASRGWGSWGWCGAGRRVRVRGEAGGLPPHPGGAELGAQLLRVDQRSSDRTPCEAWLACASIAVPACDRIWFRVYWTISCAMSASRMRLSDAVRFSTATLRLLMVWSNRFWMAPRSARVDDTVLMARSIASMPADAPEAAVALKVAVPVTPAPAMSRSAVTAPVGPLAVISP